MLESLPFQVAAVNILPFVDSLDLLALRLVSKTTFDFVHGDCRRDDGRKENNELWCQALRADFDFPISSDPENLRQSIKYRPHRSQPSNDQSRCFVEIDEIFVAESHFESWKHWKKFQIQYRQASGGPTITIRAPLFLRAGLVWEKIVLWCRSTSTSLGSNILDSLERGKAFDLNFTFPPSEPVLSDADQELQAVWSFFSGQRMYGSIGPGLFGGYSAYGRDSTTSFMSATALLEQGHPIDRTMMPISYSRGSSLGPIPKLIAFDRRNGLMCLVRMNHFDSPTWTSKTMNVSLLGWLEEYANRLSHGMFEGEGKLYPEPANGVSVDCILLYPSVKDTKRCSRAVTRGIEVIASGVDAYETAPRGEHVFIYSIRIRLLTEGEPGYLSASDRGFESCQLRSRHWIITEDGDDAQQPEHVHGDGVIGMYPLLTEAGFRHYVGEDARSTQMINGHWYKHFVYQSCTSAAFRGTFQGELTFVPGTIASPTGRPFNVTVAPFPTGMEETFY